MTDVSIIHGQRGAGNTLDANQKPDIWKEMGMLYPYATPIMQYIFWGGKKQKEVINAKGKFSWMEDELLPYKGNVKVAITASSGKLTITSTNISDVNAFNVNDLINIQDNDEMAIVESTSTNSAVLAAIDGTNLSDVTTVGSELTILTSVFTEGSGSPTAYSTVESEVSNYLTTMKRTIYTTGRDQAGARYTNGTSHAEQVQKVMKEMKLNFERLSMLSLTSGNASSAGELVQTWGKGFLGLITSNIQTTAPGSLTEALFDTWTRLLGAKGSPNKLVVAGEARYYEIQDIIKAKYGTLPTNTVVTKYGVRLKEYEYGDINLKLIRSPILGGKHTDWAIGLDEEKFTGRYMAPDLKGSRKFRVEKDTGDRGYDGRQDTVLSDLGVQYMNEQTAAILKA